MNRRAGFSIIEVVLVLGLLSIVLGMVTPGASRWRDVAATRAARDELAAGLALTRLAAVAHGGARLVVDPADARFWITTPDGPLRPAVDLAARYGVAIDTGAAGAVALEYDALGLGRVASRTITLRRGRAEAGLTVSGYGRFRRW